jgi:hypothetical protein
LTAFTATDFNLVVSPLLLLAGTLAVALGNRRQRDVHDVVRNNSVKIDDRAGEILEAAGEIQGLVNGARDDLANQLAAANEHVAHLELQVAHLQHQLWKLTEG